MLRSASTISGFKGPLFAQQSRLPKLPVPALTDTINKYLASTLPHHATPAQRAETEAAVTAALSGSDAELFRTLQARLEDRAATTDNWISDWWNETAYFGYRGPIVPYVNYYYCHANDRVRPSNIARAPALLKAFLAFRRLMETGQLEPETTKTGALDASAYPWLFNASRIPQTPVDYAEKYDAATHNHVVVLRNGKYWSFDVVSPTTGQELSESEIRYQLERILADPEAATPAAHPVGALTGTDRDEWASAREGLLRASPVNRASLEAVQSAIIVLALDNASPVLPQDVARAIWTGGKGALNRFFDKQQLVVFDNGVSGYNGEHSTMDGTPTLRLNDFALAALDAGKIDMGTTHDTTIPPPKRLEFVLDVPSEKAIEKAQEDFSGLLDQHDVEVQNFVGYGKEAIKQFKVSPDAWAQMVIQLAYWKLYGKPSPVYESAQTRKYFLGRTEVIRSCSSESTAFCKAFLDASVPDAEVHALFQAAVAQHLKYAKDAGDAQGVDRHLFGLKKLLQPSEPLPQLYTDPTFAESSTWRLSTSQISSERFASWGYGEVVDDGYGCSYAIKKDSIVWTLTARGLDTKLLAHYLKESAIDLRDFFVRFQANSKV